MYIDLLSNGEANAKNKAIEVIDTRVSLRVKNIYKLELHVMNIFNIYYKL